MNQYSELADILLSLETVMRSQGLWQQQMPSGDALASQLPFCVDTLTFPQWLQFIFVVRIKYIIQREQAIPRTSSILPMAEGYFKSVTQSGEQVLEVLRDFDQFIQECAVCSAQQVPEVIQ